MNLLDFRIDSENGWSFVLLVDGKSLAETIGATDDAIPYWLVTYGIPGWPPANATSTPYDHVMDEMSRLAAEARDADQRRR